MAQGIDAGGHRGGLTDDGTGQTGGEPYGLLALIRRITGIPVIAAGGLATGADIAAVLTAGAVAAQLGTAFLRADEAGTSEPYRRALQEGGRKTTVTRAFSGRPARGLTNRFIDEHDAHAPAAYPQVNNATKPIRAAAAQQQDVEAMSLWAGRNYALAEAKPTADIIERLAADARDALGRRL